jgi:hypothetical protein
MERTVETSNEMAPTRKFLRWLWSVNSGMDRRFQYHEGFLARDRWMPMRLGEPLWPNPAIEQLAQHVWKAYEQGQVHLVQEKLENGEFAYWAVKTKEQL